MLSRLHTLVPPPCIIVVPVIPDRRATFRIRLAISRPRLDPVLFPGQSPPFCQQVCITSVVHVYLEFALAVLLTFRCAPNVLTFPGTLSAAAALGLGCCRCAWLAWD